jgi:hypothetical protein
MAVAPNHPHQQVSFNEWRNAKPNAFNGRLGIDRRQRQSLLGGIAMRHVCLVAAVAIAFLGVGSAAKPGEGPTTDYQEVADRWPWQWSPDRADLLTAVAFYRGSYQVDIVKPKGDKERLRIGLTDDGREVFSWAGHRHSVFSQDGDVLFYADYWPDRTGCEIVARDLKAGKELWRTRLHGLGPIKHSGYSNRVAMEADHLLVTVRGKETLGRYLEFLDPRTGRILGHRIYEGPYRLKRNGEWLNLPPAKWNDPTPSLQDDAPAAEKPADDESRIKMLWKRLAVLAIQKFLEPPARKDLAALVSKRLASPLEYMEVVDANETARAIEHLHNFAELENTPFPKVDLKAVLVVYLNGPVGGAWRIGAVFDRLDGTTKAVVFIPGK